MCHTSVVADPSSCGGPWREVGLGLGAGVAGNLIMTNSVNNDSRDGERKAI